MLYTVGEFYDKGGIYLENKLEQAKKIIEKYEQNHLLNFYSKLNNEKKEELINQILEIDFELLNNLYKNINNVKNSRDEITPIPYTDKAKINEQDLEKYKNKGIEEIKNNKYAVVTMAGGQGTRLGHSGPKGTFMLDLQPKKSLFEIFCDKLKLIKEKYNVIIPWYLMTSKENNNATVEFFEKNNYFNYPKEAVKFFIQGEIPMIDKNGKIILTEDGLIKNASNGHGGIFEAMFKNDVVKDMKDKGIEWVFIGPVDNPLVQMTDEIFIGYAAEKKVLAVGKSIVKANPEEKVGVFCKRNGRPSVVEYTEITKEMAEQKNENNELAFGESHINCNLFNIKAIEKIGDEKLPYHTAFKKATYMNENGEIIKPEEPNCYKFETFIFDSFEKLDNMEILRGKREEEFAPVKNKEGVDSPETAIELYKKYYNI